MTDIVTTKPKTVLVDADMLCYLSQDPEEEASYILHSVRLMLERIKDETKCSEMRVFLSSLTNFRYDVDPNYKISRRDIPKPPHYQTTKNYLMKYWDAEVSPDGYEADDYIAQLQADDTCIASLDKDFLTVTGWHYKWKNHGSGELFWVTEDDAEAFLSYQLLTGDSADSIISPLKKYKKDGTLGKVGFGHVAARDFLLEHDYDVMRAAVAGEYKKQGFLPEFAKNYKLLAIGRIYHEQLTDSDINSVQEVGQD